jgi:hypothetical protein
MIYKTGPYRTSIDCMIEYEEFYQDPFAKKTKGNKKLIVSPHCIKNLATLEDESEIRRIHMEVFDTQEQACAYFNKHLRNEKHRGLRKIKPYENGDYVSTIRSETRARSLDEMKQYTWKELLPKAKQMPNQCKYYACYENINDKNTLKFCLVHSDDYSL